MDLSTVFQSYGRVANAPVSASVGAKFRLSCRICGANPAVEPLSLLDSDDRFCIRCVENTREEVIAQAIQSNPSLARIVMNASSEEAREGMSTSQKQSGYALAAAVAGAADFLVTQGDGALQARMQCGLAYVDADTLKPVVNAMSQLLPSIAEQLGNNLTPAENYQWAAIVGILLQVIKRYDSKTMDVLALPSTLMRNLQSTLRVEYNFKTTESPFFFPQGGSEAEGEDLMPLPTTMVNFVVENARQRVLWRAEAEAQREKSAASVSKSSGSKESKSTTVRWMK